MTSFWSAYIIIFAAIVIAGCSLLLLWTRKKKADDFSGKEAKVMPHSFDGIQEYDNPLPRWWMWMFWISIVFTLVYLVLYPGLGSFKGTLGWTSVGQWQHEMDKAEVKYKPIFEQYAKVPAEELAKDQKAMGIGQRLFANNCAVCHGSDARGNKGFPNLTDNDWLYGGAADTIKTSITHGRSGMMPAWKDALGEQGVDEVAMYVASLSKKNVTGPKVEAGKKRFAMMCVGCHGMDAKGNQALGAPNLTDNTWLYGGSLSDLKTTISNGRNGKMPVHEGRISPEKIHILAAYVFSLSH